ncbi:hypothetical protein [Lewinella sp. IMCC34183]|uniref:hypothetical protein n=1 Tax=Lewinella sp. IMCC34183 TaxID=2248762 RepID=UPI000E2603C6|nr:hypothetical protein [Lewinella sp. IMCC34183]
MDPARAPDAEPKPKWLRKLERESWQAELIISGAAIVGSLQLPGLIDQMEGYFLLNYDRDSLFISYIASIYWRVLATSLIATFIFHFVVRAMWIGLVGLNSVYPGGFQTNERFSQHHQERMKAEFGDIDGFIRRLDRLGSGIFGVAFALAGVFLNFGIVGVVFLFIHSWLVTAGFTSRQVFIGMGVLLAPLLLLSVLTMVSHSARYRDHPLVRRYQWPISMVVSRFTYPVARKYITTSINLVTSYYADQKGFGWKYLLGLVSLIVVMLLSLLANRQTLYFIDNYYHRIANDSLLLATNVSGKEAFDGIYVRPILTGESPITSEGLTVWIPLPEREMFFLESGCSVALVPEGLDRQEARMRRREWLVQCAGEYLSFAVNGEPAREFELERQYLTNAAGDQYGIRAFLPDPPLRKGKNLLRVTTQYPHEDTGEPRIAYLPFYHY